jgi:hypothetical protein
MAIARTRREHLQRIVGNRGTVQPYVAVADLEHRGIGWYYVAHEALEGCSCDCCQAAREGRAAFLAGGALLAATVLHTYAADHPAPARHPASATPSRCRDSPR